MFFLTLLRLATERVDHPLDSGEVGMSRRSAFMLPLFISQLSEPEFYEFSNEQNFINSLIL